jgi:hypothetical protein
MLIESNLGVTTTSNLNPKIPLVCPEIWTESTKKVSIVL